MKQSKLAKIFKALSNEQRLKLFLNIYNWEELHMGPEEDAGCCKGIDKVFTKACGCMELSRSTISHHLKELQNADLITCTRNGQSTICKINIETVNVIKDFLE